MSHRGVGATLDVLAGQFREETEGTPRADDSDRFRSPPTSREISILLKPVAACKMILACIVFGAGWNF